MNYHGLLDQIKKGKFSSAYLFVGPEDYLVEIALEKLIAAKVDPATREFNFDTFYGEDTEGAKILDTANAYPMMAESRMVVVKNLHKLSSSALDRIAKYLVKPSPSTLLVLIGEKVDLRTKAISRIKAKSCFVEFKPLYDRQIPGWIREHLQERGLEISQDAILLLQSRIGNNLRNIVNELDKIIVNLNSSKKIDVEDVQKVVGFSKNFSIFDLTDAVGFKDLSKALAISNQMLESGESPTAIIAMITRHFANLVKLKAAVSKNKSQSEISALTGIPSFFINKTKQMAGNFSTNELERVFDMLLKTDLVLKTSQQPPHIALQTLLVQIIKKI